MYFILRNLVSQFDENINVKVPSKRQYYGILRMAAKEITIFASEKIYSIFDAILKLLKWKIYVLNSIPLLDFSILEQNYNFGYNLRLMMYQINLNSEESAVLGEIFMNSFKRL